MLWKFILLATTLDLIKCQEETKLLLVQMLFRHGDRAPVQLYPTDPNPEDVWPEGLGRLTKLGKRQQYSLGKLFRHLYRDFVTTNPNEVTVNSSASDRCLRSAQATVAAFYAPTSKWSFESCVDWQPIPVYYAPQDQDKYLYPGSRCPAATTEIKNIMKGPQVQQFLSEHKEILDYLSTHSGKQIQDALSVLLFIDTLHIEKKHNLIIPSWAYTYWDKYKKILHQAYQFFINSPVLLRLRAGPILGKITEDMKRKINHEIPDIKVRIYSTHDLLVLGVLDALQFSDVGPPPYSATIIFELHEKMDGGKAVRLLYLNSTTPEDVSQEPHVLTLDGCAEYCPLEHFFQHTKDVIPENWESECGLDESRGNLKYGEMEDEGKFLKELQASSAGVQADCPIGTKFTPNANWAKRKEN